MAITTIEGYPRLMTGRIGASGADGSIWLYQPNIAAGWAQVGTAGTVAWPPVNTVAPVISGTPTSGQTLTVSNGTWGNSPTSFTYAWWSGNQLIQGANANTYVLTPPDKNNMITAQITAINANGSGVARSPAVGPVN